MPLTGTLLKSRIIIIYILNLTFHFRCMHYIIYFSGLLFKNKNQEFLYIISYKVFKIDYLLTIYHMATVFFFLLCVFFFFKLNLSNVHYFIDRYTLKYFSISKLIFRNNFVIATFTYTNITNTLKT